MPVIEAHDLKRTFGDGGRWVNVLGGVELNVQQGEFVAITGPSGSGKSTLLHLLGGVDAPTSGQVLLEGVNLADLSDDDRTILRRRRIGFIFQSFNLLPTLSAQRNVALPLLLNGMSFEEATLQSLMCLQMVGMGHRNTHLPSQLSGGEQQRVAIARALAIKPAVLLADEPTGNLDSANGQQVTSLLRKLVDEQQQTIVMVTHDRSVAAQADRLICFRDGMIESDTPQTPTDGKTSAT